MPAFRTNIADGSLIKYLHTIDAQHKEHFLMDLEISLLITAQQSKNAVCTDYTLFYLGRFLKKLADDQSSSIN